MYMNITFQNYFQKGKKYNMMGRIVCNFPSGRREQRNLMNNLNQTGTH